jgi:hypothetical protein
VATTGIARRTPHRVRPVGRLDDAWESARVVESVIRFYFARSSRRPDRGVLVFVGPARDIYALPDCHAEADGWLRNRGHWLVGAFSPHDDLLVTLDDAIREHMRLMYAEMTAASCS